MHKLERTEAPPCLSGYDHRTQHWDDISADCKKATRTQLDAMQGPRCAYCESSIEFEDSHIEHFRRKGGPPPQPHRHLMFDWDNLFLSCDSRAHCGHYKDRPSAPPYDPNDLIKPDIEDPHRLLYFHRNGAIRPRKGLNEAERDRVSETIRVFNLEEKLLVANRRSAVDRYLRQNEKQADLDELMNWSAEDRRAWLDLEIDAIRDQPYVSTLLHFLGTHA